MKLLIILAVTLVAVAVNARVVDYNRQKHLDKIKYEYNDKLFQGDILGEENIRGAASYQTLLARRWDKGVVPYEIGAEYSDKDRQIILDGMKHVEDVTRRNGKDCITFKPRTSETQYVSVFNGTGCYSYVGRQILMTGQQLSIRSPGCNYVGTVAHEFMHALGFYHEQSRTDRDGYIKVNFENVIEGTENNFDKLKENQNDQLLAFKYDYGSIMHYDAFAFSKNGQPTIEVLQEDVFIGNRDWLTAQDADEIRRMYGCDRD